MIADSPRIDQLTAGLRAAGVAACDDFLSSTQTQALADCASARRARGEFAPARIGAGESLQHRADIRGDSICWLEGRLLPAERLLVLRLEAMRRRLNRSLFLGLSGLELQYAWYPAGAGYARHVDQPRGHDTRRLTCIVYLNAGWQPADGGSLRCSSDDGTVRELEPKGGRMVLFLTADREHEVLPTHKDRLSITGWFLGRMQHALL